MTTYLLTWKPDKWPIELFSQLYERWLADANTTETWRCSNTTVTEGDEVFLVRQMPDPRGLLAHGVVVRGSYRRPHPDGSDKTQRVIDVRFHALGDPTAAPVVPRFELDKLEHPPKSSWDVQSSGVLIPDGIADSLRALWRKYWQSAAGSDWSVSENTAVVQAYFKMLIAELRGEPYVKRRENEAVREFLRGRTAASVEFKFRNISAVLEELGYRRIEGYRPAENAQRSALTRTVLEYLDGSPETLALLEAEATRVPPTPDVPASFGSVLESPPARTVAKPEARDFTPEKWSPERAAERDLRNKKLGAAGEEFVVKLEQSRLCETGRPDLASKVRWVSRDDGDGAGYDIRSFGDDEAPLFIEVKTTNGGPRTDFLVTANEVAFAQTHAAAYALYRLHSFSKSPRLFILRGALNECVRLEPTGFRARFEELAEA